MTPAEKDFNRFLKAFITVCYVRVVVCIIHFIKMWFYEYMYYSSISNTITGGMEKLDKYHKF